MTSAAGGPALRIVQLGYSTTVQDRGRPGLAHLGVPTAGAVDLRTHDQMNRLVGNPADAATIETMGALIVEALRPVVVATSTDGHRQTLAAGARVHVDVPSHSVWAYLAVRGGVDTQIVLGSRSHDTLGNVGPPPLALDSLVAIGDDPGTPLDADHAPLYWFPRNCPRITSEGTSGGIAFRTFTFPASPSLAPLFLLPVPLDFVRHA